jgi:hypothetical protein
MNFHCVSCNEKGDAHFFDIVLAIAVEHQNIPAIKQLFCLQGIDLNWIPKCKDHSREYNVKHKLRFSTNIEMIELFLAQPTFRYDPKTFCPLEKFCLRGTIYFNDSDSEKKERERIQMNGFLHFAFHPRVFYVPDAVLGESVTSEADYSMKNLEWLLAVGRCFYKKTYTFINDSCSKEAWWRNLTLSLSEHYDLAARGNQFYKNNAMYISKLHQLSFDFRRFEVHPKSIIQKYRKEVGLEWDLASEVFVLSILMGDGYLTLHETASPETRRFFAIVGKLPLEIQMLLSQRSCGSSRDMIKSACIEKACKLALGLCVF